MQLVNLGCHANRKGTSPETARPIEERHPRIVSSRSGAEAPVMGRSHGVDPDSLTDLATEKQVRHVCQTKRAFLPEGSRMTGACYVRICEKLGVETSLPYWEEPI